MPPEGFEPAVSASERLQCYALDRAASEVDQTGDLGKVIIGVCCNLQAEYLIF